MSMSFPVRLSFHCSLPLEASNPALCLINSLWICDSLLRCYISPSSNHLFKLLATEVFLWGCTLHTLTNYLLFFVTLPLWVYLAWPQPMNLKWWELQGMMFQEIFRSCVLKLPWTGPNNQNQNTRNRGFPGGPQWQPAVPWLSLWVSSAGVASSVPGQGN